MTDEENFDVVSPTAVLCARARADITFMPYAREIYEQIKGQECCLDTLYPVLMRLARLFPNWFAKAGTLEGRYASTNAALDRLGDCNILELAAGISPRGLEYADGNRIYVETDLPEILVEKERIVRAIREREGRLVKNHFFDSVNVVNDNLEQVSKHFMTSSKPVTIIHEGLWTYLKRDEQAKARDNIAGFLRRHSSNGAWITPDFSYASSLTRDNSLVGLAKWRIKRTTRRGDRFNSEQEVHDFLREAGLRAEVLPNEHLAEKLSCVGILGLDVERVRKHIRDCRAWYITLQN